jgi:drug/metabolite transporter (DMT)-like permease
MKRLPGILLILVSAASFGTLAIFGRYAYADGLDVFTLLFLRFSFAAVVITGLLIFRHERLPGGKNLVLLICMGAIGYVGQSYSYLTAIRFASAGLVALLLYLYPVFVAILSTMFLKETFTGLKFTALALATIGAAMTANPQGGNWTGIILAFMAAGIYSIYIIIGAGVMEKVSAVSSSTIIFASAGIVFGILTAINHPHWPSSSVGWWAIAAITLIATVIPVVTFLAGLKIIGPTNASMLSTFEPVVTVLLAALLFGERLGPVILVGGGLILASVILLTRDELTLSGKIEER